MTAAPRPRPGVHLLPLEPGAILFCEASQNLYALNGAAALAWCGLEDGLDEAEALAGVIEAGAPAGEAPAWYRQSIEMFRLRGLLEGTKPPEPPPVKARAFGEGGHPIGQELPLEARIYLRAYDSLVELRLAHSALRLAMEAIFAGLVVAPDRPPEIMLGLGQTSEGWVVTKGGVIAARADSLAEIASEVDHGVIQLALERASYLLEFRGALMARRGEGFLFAGPSGSGKTTLATGLMHRGWSFGGDERVLLRRDDFRLRAAPKSLRLNRGSWSVLAPLFAEIETSPVYGRPDRPLRYLAPRGLVLAEAAVHHVVFPQYRNRSTTALTPVPRHEGLQELFAACASVSRPLALSDVVAIVDWSNGVKFHRLEIADLVEALDLLEQRFR